MAGSKPILEVVFYKNTMGNQPVKEWLKALPLGNGFLGAMVYGDVNNERIQLNGKSLWSGSPYYNDNPEAYSSLEKIRKLPPRT